MSLQTDIDIATTVGIVLVYSVGFYLALEVRKYSKGFPFFWKVTIVALVLLAAHSVGYALVDTLGLASAAEVAIIDDIGHLAIAVLFLVSFYYLRLLWKENQRQIRAEIHSGEQDGGSVKA